MVYPTTRNNKSKIFSRLFLISSIAALLSFSSCYYDNEEALYPVRPGSGCDTTNPTYALTILPIMQNNCTGCHSGGAPSGNLDLTTYDNVVAGFNSHHLFDHVTQNGYSIMPPSGSLSDCDINKLYAWIGRGMPSK